MAAACSDGGDPSAYPSERASFRTAAPVARTRSAMSDATAAHSPFIPVARRTSVSAGGTVRFGGGGGGGASRLVVRSQRARVITLRNRNASDVPEAVRRRALSL